MRDPRYDVLFEPLKIGPVTTKNRFYQVPHCTGMGWLRPNMLAEMRGVKAEGGWGVVNTEYCSVHPTSDDVPFPYASLWDEEDIRTHALMTEKVHSHGALAGVELWYGGSRSANLLTRGVSFDVGSIPAAGGYPTQSKMMDKEDIRQYREWHRKAALRARQAGFDIVYVYANHEYLVANFLNPKLNQRTDEYGGSVENRTRLCRELIEETKEVVGDKCAVAVRISIDDSTDAQNIPENEDSREIFSLLAEMPDLWDVSVENYSREMGASRFVGEGALEPYISFAKANTSKPVVSVGRFTSPDAMASQVKRGVVDLIGAARPSIADPFLPKKIEEGRLEDIRECIGCNICYSSDGLGVPIRCTQNPSMGEEWRLRWHPEKIREKASDAKILVVGAGPAGLECARALGQRGYTVLLSEAQRDLGGRVSLESSLPRLSELARVRDYRVQQIQNMPNVEVYLESPLSADDVLLVEPDHAVIATGSIWCKDGFGRSNLAGIDGFESDVQVFTPDDIMAGNLPSGNVVIFDDDGYYMAATLAERLLGSEASVIFVTPSSLVAPFCARTAEQYLTQTNLIECGVQLELAHNMDGFDGREAELSCIYSGRSKRVAADALVLVTARTANDQLYHELVERIGNGHDGPLCTVRAIGDAYAPSIVANAVYSGHRYAQEFDSPDASSFGVLRDSRHYLKGVS
ncbi:MAG: FAD-dependent oxidoreductase [Hyphomicrobiales bacterium]